LGTYPEVEIASLETDIGTYNVGDVFRDGHGITEPGGIAVSGYTTAGDVHGSAHEGGSARPDSIYAGLERKYWDGAIDSADLQRNNIRNTDLSLLGPTNIEIQFANDFAIVLVSCFFVSRSSGIQIDENVILEEHTFFARATYTKDLE
jgi:hypothetical protein